MPKGRGSFAPRSFPTAKRALLELSAAIHLLYASEVSARAISRFLQLVYGAMGIRTDGRREVLGFWPFGPRVSLPELDGGDEGIPGA